MRLIDTQAELDAFEEEVAGMRTSLRSIDVSKGFLVVGGYSNCQGSSSVTYDEGARTLTFASHQPDNIACAWSPYTLDVWHIGRDEVGGVDPGTLTVGRA